MTDLQAKPFDSRAYSVDMVTLDVDLAAARNKAARRAASEYRRGLLVDYLLTVETADESPADTSLAAAARDALALYLVAEGEYPTADTAAAAIDARQVSGMPVPGKNYSEVPF
jgi:hypothetical protein